MTTLYLQLLGCYGLHPSLDALLAEGQLFKTELKARNTSHLLAKFPNSIKQKKALCTQHARTATSKNERRLSGPFNRNCRETLRAQKNLLDWSALEHTPPIANIDQQICAQSLAKNGVPTPTPHPLNFPHVGLHPCCSCNSPALKRSNREPILLRAEIAESPGPASSCK